MKLLYFAAVRQKLGCGEEEFSLPAGVTTARELAASLRARGPAYDAVFADLSGLRLAVDQDHASWDADVTAAGEIAFFPPVTGG